MRTIVYIDGFNLYYGALKRTPYRWLDLGALCARLLPSDTLLAIKYYTAPVRALPHDPQQPQRQQVYLRALRTSQTSALPNKVLRADVGRRPASAGARAAHIRRSPLVDAA